MNINDVLNNLNQISEKLFKSVENEVYSTLDSIVNITPDILNKEPLNKLFLDGKINGIVMIANSLILFYITYYIFSQLLSLYNGDKAENLYTFIIKMCIIGVLTNNSYYIVESILDINSKFTECIQIYGKELTGNEITFENLKEKIISIKDFVKNDFLSLDGLIKGIISFGAISVLINFSIRYVTVILLIYIFPIILVTMSSNASIGIFKSYFKILLTNLLIGSFVKLIIIIPISYKDVNSIMYKIILVGSMYLIYRINTFAKEILIKISEERKHRITER